MLPSRPRLQSWNPDSLSPAAKAISGAGQTVYRAVRSLDDECDRMPEARTWSGPAHRAATDMFRRATDATSPLSHYAEAVAMALDSGSGSIGGARTALLREADHIDQGELHVTDQWVVVIKPATMSAEKAASLQKQAEAAQGEINRLLLSVGEADDATAAKVQAAAKDFGFHLPGPGDMSSLDPNSGVAKPADEVPNPRTIQGLMAQGAIRGEDMGRTVRESRETKDKDGNVIKTLVMQDGTKHVLTEYDSWNTKKLDYVVDEYFSPNGAFISRAASWKELNGVKWTQIDWGKNTYLTMSETPDGVRSAGWILPDGRSGEVPPGSPLFTGGLPDLYDAGITGLDAHIGRGGGIPMLTADSVADAGKGLKYLGPQVAITAALYDAATSGTLHGSCVAAAKAGAGYFAGDVGAGLGVDLGAAAGSLVPGAEPVTIPLFAILGGYAFGKLGENVGTKVGEAFCPG